MNAILPNSVSIRYRTGPFGYGAAYMCSSCGDEMLVDRKLFALVENWKPTMSSACGARSTSRAPKGTPAEARSGFRRGTRRGWCAERGSPTTARRSRTVPIEQLIDADTARRCARIILLCRRRPHAGSAVLRSSPSRDRPEKPAVRPERDDSRSSRVQIERHGHVGVEQGPHVPARQQQGDLALGT